MGVRNGGSVCTIALWAVHYVDEGGDPGGLLFPVRVRCAEPELCDRHLDVVGVLLFVTGCESEYMVDRGADLVDVQCPSLFHVCFDRDLSLCVGGAAVVGMEVGDTGGLLWDRIDNSDHPGADTIG